MQQSSLAFLGGGSVRILLACVASVSVLFRSKERPRNEILGFGRARNETRAKKFLSPHPLPAYSRHFSRGLCSDTARICFIYGKWVYRGVESLCKLLTPKKRCLLIYQQTSANQNTVHLKTGFIWKFSREWLFWTRYASGGSLRKKPKWPSVKPGKLVSSFVGCSLLFLKIYVLKIG